MEIHGFGLFRSALAEESLQQFPIKLLILLARCYELACDLLEFIWRTEQQIDCGLLIKPIYSELDYVVKQCFSKLCFQTNPFHFCVVAPQLWVIVQDHQKMEVVIVVELTFLLLYLLVIFHFYQINKVLIQT